MSSQVELRHTAGPLASFGHMQGPPIGDGILWKSRSFSPMQWFLSSAAWGLLIESLVLIRSWYAPLLLVFFEVSILATVAWSTQVVVQGDILMIQRVFISSNRKVLKKAPRHLIKRLYVVSAWVEGRGAYYRVLLDMPTSGDSQRSFCIGTFNKCIEAHALICRIQTWVRSG